MLNPVRVILNLFQNLRGKLVSTFGINPKTMQKQKVKKHQQISTKLGAIVLAIIALTVGVFVWKIGKDQEGTEQSQNVVTIKKPQPPAVAQQNQAQRGIDDPGPTNITQPPMPSFSDEAEKSPAQLVEDFYNWYIGSTNYIINKIYNQHDNTDPINLDTLLKKSPFISSNYEQNMQKRRGMYDAILCTNDNEFNIIKEYGEAQINGNYAEVSILRGYARNDDTTKIQILLKKEENQWKINDIICNFPTK